MASNPNQRRDHRDGPAFTSKQDARQGSTSQLNYRVLVMGLTGIVVLFTAIYVVFLFAPGAFRYNSPPRTPQPADAQQSAPQNLPPRQ